MGLESQSNNFSPHLPFLYTNLPCISNVLPQVHTVPRVGKDLDEQRAAITFGGSGESGRHRHV